MAWPWRRRTTPATTARHAVPRQARRWAEPALPPQQAEQPPPSTVLLGFTDGSQVTLDARDPSAVALRAVADLLVQDRAD